MSFGENLQKLRKERNISQESLAEELQVSRQTIGKWENGVTYPETECLIQISDFFKVSLDTLLKGTIAENGSAETTSVDTIGEESVPLRAQQISDAGERRQRNRNIRFVVAVVLFIIAPFYPGSSGAGSVDGFLMILSIAVGIGLLIYNHKTKEQAE